MKRWPTFAWRGRPTQSTTARSTRAWSTPVSNCWPRPRRPDHRNSISIPVGLARLRLHQVPEGPLWAHARLSDVDQLDPRLIMGSVQLHGTHGPVLTIEGLRLMHLPRRALIAETVQPGWLHELTWKPAQRSEASSQANQRAGTWLILADQGGCADDLARRLAGHGQRSVLVLPGESCRADGERRWRVAPGRHEDFAHVLRAALPEGETWRGVVHLWSLDATAPSVLAADQALVCASALHLTQALAAARGTPRVWFVTAGAQSLAIAPGISAPVTAALWGFGRTLAVEQPELWGGLIDLDPGQADRFAAHMLNELLAPDDERQVAFRGGQRYAARLERRAVTGEAGVPLRLRADGTYLITGGLGALGLRLARRLAERGARHLVLVGRSDPAEAVRAGIRALEALDAQVRVLRADVANEGQAAAVLDQINQSLPPLRGVFHAAGVLDDGLISRQSWIRFADVLRPKLAGAWHLHTLTRAVPLDYFVLFSSAAAVLGSPGQASYAAANACLDGLARWRRSLGLPALSVNWGPWAGDGMAAHTDAARRWEAVGLTPIDPEKGLDMLEYLLQQPGPGEVGVLPADWPRFARQFPGGVPPLFAALSEQGGEPEDSGEIAERNAWLERLLAADPDRRLQLLAAHVREQVMTVLKMPPATALNQNQGLFELGMELADRPGGPQPFAAEPGPGAAGHAALRARYHPGPGGLPERSSSRRQFQVRRCRPARTMRHKSWPACWPKSRRSRRAR